MKQAPVPADPNVPDGATLPCLSIRLGRTKTTDADLGAQVLLIGRPVTALEAWIARAGIAEAGRRGIQLLDAMQLSQHHLATTARPNESSARPQGS